MPFYQLDVARVQEMAHGKCFVIFHCYYSQTRGPTAAHAFYQHLQKIAALGQDHPKVLILRGGFKSWKGLFSDNPNYLEKF